MSKTPIDDQAIGAAARTAEQAIHSAQRAAHEALDSLAHTVEDIRHRGNPLIQEAGATLGALAQRGAHRLSDASLQLRHQAARASHGVERYVHREPLNALLVAAAGGAALMALLSLLIRSHPER